MTGKFTLCFTCRFWRLGTLQIYKRTSQSHDDTPEVEEPYYEVEKILRWRKVKIKNKITKQYLVLWRGYPVEDAMWIEANQFSYPEQLQDYLREDKPQEEKI